MITNQKIEDWMDDFFFEQGTFTVINDDQTLILGKGGFYSEKKIPESPVFFYIKEFYSPKYYYYYPESILEVTRKDAQTVLKPYLDLRISFENSENFDKLFEEDFNKLKMELNDQFQKAVLISSEKTGVSNTNQLKKKIIAKSICSTVGIPYGVWDTKYAIIGSSPEILFEKEQDHIQSVALAGTAKRGQENHLINSQKERKEHNIVISNIIQGLEPFCSQISKSETEIAPFSKMIHLKTSIQGLLKPGSEIMDIINTLSPTAALGGYPKQRAKEFLKTTQYFKRFPNRYFGSVFGFNYHDRHRALVMIRNIQIKENDMIIEAGAGIIHESEIGNELNEIKLKRSTVKELFL
jgi:menaquinone-specific isochorismate synthase